MNDSQKGRMLNIKLIILNIVIIIMAFIFLVILWFTLQELTYSFSPYQYEEDSFIYAMESENYGRIVTMYNENCNNGYGDKKNLQECYGVAKYYEAAFDYKVCVNIGDTAGAEEQQVLMDEAQKQMGDFAFMTDKIDEKLGLAE